MTKRTSQTAPEKFASNGGISTLPSGVPGFDAIVGGGVPQYSCNRSTGKPVV